MLHAVYADAIARSATRRLPPMMRRCRAALYSSCRYALSVIRYAKAFDVTVIVMPCIAAHFSRFRALPSCRFIDYITPRRHTPRSMPIDAATPSRLRAYDAAYVADVCFKMLSRHHIDAAAYVLYAAQFDHDLRRHLTLLSAYARHVMPLARECATPRFTVTFRCADALRARCYAQRCVMLLIQ